MIIKVIAITDLYKTFLKKLTTEDEIQTTTFWAIKQHVICSDLDEVGRREMYAAMCRQKIRHRQFFGQNFECLKDNLMKRYWKNLVKSDKY